MDQIGLDLKHERVDDIPLLVGLAEKMKIRETVDSIWRRHHLEQGLSTGTLVTIWLAYILSEGDHRKSHVEEWVNQHRETLSRLTGESLRDVVEFSDDRLGLVLRRLSQIEQWHACEDALSKGVIEAFDVERIRLDTTTSYGYHSVSEDGIMQLGHSKDHRPDLGQLKLMLGAVEPIGIPVASEVHPGQSADDPLYVPLIERIQKMVGRRGLLFAGDSKMAALSTRVFLVQAGDFYLIPLPMTGKTKAEMEGWIESAVSGICKTECIQRGNDLLGAGYEFERKMEADEAGNCVNWTERVLISQSTALAKQQAENLEKRLGEASEALMNLTPKPGRGRRQFREEDVFKQAIDAILETHHVAGLLDVTQGVEKARTVRYVITAVNRNEAEIGKRKERLGWRAQVTNVPREKLSLGQCVVAYRDGWSIERDFHLLKDRPLGISPLYVRRDDQITGLTNLLLLALRMLIMLETMVRDGLKSTKTAMKGLYEGLPKKTTESPTATLILRAVARTQITLTRVQLDGHTRMHLTPIAPLVSQVMTHLGLPDSLYLSLIHASPY